MIKNNIKEEIRYNSTKDVINQVYTRKITVFGITVFNHHYILNKEYGGAECKIRGFHDRTTELRS